MIETAFAKCFSSLGWSSRRATIVWCFAGHIRWFRNHYPGCQQLCGISPRILGWWRCGWKHRNVGRWRTWILHPTRIDVLTILRVVGRDKSRPWNQNAPRPNSLLRGILKVARLCTMLLRSSKLPLQAGLAAYCCLGTPVRINPKLSTISWPPADDKQKIPNRSRIFLHQKCTQHAMLGMISAKMVSWSVPPIWLMLWMSRTLPNLLQMRHRYKFKLGQTRH